VTRPNGIGLTISGGVSQFAGGRFDVPSSAKETNVTTDRAIRASIAVVALLANTARAEVKEVAVAQLYGIAYLPLMIMEDGKLLEKHARMAGLGDLKVSWTKFSGTNVANDALLSGRLHFASGGVPGFATLWASTRGTLEARAVGAMCSMPLYLNTRNPNLKTIKDLTGRDRIALPAVKLSAQSIVLQMAAEQAFGSGNHYRLDPLTVSMSHPDGMAAMLSGTSEVNSHFASPPYQYEELRRPGIHTILSSYDVLGGPSIFTLVYSTGKFRQENPRVFDAFVRAFEEAMDLIGKNKRAAAEIYVRLSKDNESAETILEMLTDPTIEYGMTPKNMMKQVDFMYRIGSIKVRPDSWKDLFFQSAHELPGS
jgi:sulfonate transport system substrate-binding protein